MTATDELRRMLDERGVEWRTDLSVTNKVEWTIWPSPWFREVWAKEIDGRVSIFNAPMTPAQAIEATLGRGTCHITVQDNMTETEGMGDVWLECDACGWQMPLEPSTPRFNYCPNCGRRVEQ